MFDERVDEEPPGVCAGAAKYAEGLRGRLKAPVAR
jgi:hypothetical protein